MNRKSYTYLGALNYVLFRKYPNANRKATARDGFQTNLVRIAR